MLGPMKQSVLGETFEKVIRNLSLVQREERFETLLMFTVMKRNYQSLPSLLSLCPGVRGERIDP